MGILKANTSNVANNVHSLTTTCGGVVWQPGETSSALVYIHLYILCCSLGWFNLISLQINLFLDTRVVIHCVSDVHNVMSLICRCSAFYTDREDQSILCTWVSYIICLCVFIRSVSMSRYESGLVRVFHLCKLGITGIQNSVWITEFLFAFLTSHILSSAVKQIKKTQ